MKIHHLKVTFLILTSITLVDEARYDPQEAGRDRDVPLRPVQDPGRHPNGYGQQQENHQGKRP